MRKGVFEKVTEGGVFNYILSVTQHNVYSGH